MSSFDKLLDSMAQAQMNAFRLSGVEYFYEDRKRCERLPIQCTEQTIRYQEHDPHTGQTMIRSEKSFKILRRDFDAIDAWRREKKDGRPQTADDSRDCIVKVKDGVTEKYEISYRDPVTVMGVNRASYRINTTFIGHG
jgi:hypothetical protein